MDFQSSYNRNEFLKFLRNNLLWEKFEEHVEQTSITKEFKSSFFTSITKLWVVEEFENLIVLEIEHKSKNDARISLTKDIFKLLRQFELEWLVRQNALVILKNPDTEQYRFSLLTTTYNEDFEEKLSNPKRYSFLLGKWEKTKTPRDYLEKKGKVETLEKLIERFNVETVRNVFFNEYLNLYIRLYKWIVNDLEFLELLKSENVNIVSFTKNLLGKIIFLYFVQKKGWFKNKKDWKWDFSFMKNIWDDFKVNNERNVVEWTGFFYNDYLEYIFYEWLNLEDRTGEFNLKFWWDIPYLNWGLFKEDYWKWKINKSKISNEIFSNDNEDWILDIFNTYNFTIDEDDLYDKDIAVDPEMLGRIFEKMIAVDENNIEKIVKIYDKKSIKKGGWFIKMDIEKWKVWNNNKKLGAFYTPRDIVHYMTKESLISYLINNLKGVREEKEYKVRKLFEFKEKYLIESDFSDDEKKNDFHEVKGIILDIDDKLRKVKIIDPAIGSWAFPMWILHEISTLRYYIYDVLSKQVMWKDWNISMYNIKKDIIQNNIYWVDISSWAIDIARLRFWLSLIVEEDKPKPLPNFEFKFVCANTLIPLINEWWIYDNIDEEKLREKINKWFFSQANKYDEWKEKLKLSIKEIFQKWHSNIFASEKEKQLITFNPFKNKRNAEFFDYNLMFWIRRGEKFDIVIWNPPYIKEYDNRSAFDWLRDKPYYIWKMDLWYYFACYTLDFLKDWWIQSFIAQNNWITSHWARIIRNKILEDAKIKEFIDFWDYKVFENVWIQTMIYILEKTKNNLNYELKYSRLYNKNYNRKNINKFLYDDNNTSEYTKHYSKIWKTKYLDKTIDFANEEKWNILSKMMTNSDFKLIEKDIAQWIVPNPDIVNKKNLLKITENEGIKVGDGVFVIEKNKFKSDYLYPLYETENIDRYFFKIENNKEIIYIPNKTILGKNSDLYKHLYKYREIMEDRRENKLWRLEFYNLHWWRDKSFFTNWPKIVIARKSDRPSFSYIEENCFVMLTFNVIKTDWINLKYLTWLLNSKLIEFWLKNKGKMQWDNYQIDKEPLLNIPLINPSEEDQKPFIKLVDKILKITKQDFYDPKNIPKEQLDLESEIDDMVYELYGLSEEEVRVVEESLK